MSKAQLYTCSSLDARIENMSFTATFGSLGDFISVSILVKDILLALDDTGGSSHNYQEVVRELYILDTASLQVEKLSSNGNLLPSSTG